MKNWRRRFFNLVTKSVCLIYPMFIKGYFFSFWIGQYDPFHTIIVSINHTIIDKFYFVLKKICCLLVLPPRIWNVLWMRFSIKNLLHQLKNGEMTQRYQKSYFSVLFWGWNNAKSKHMGMSFKSHFKHLIFKVAVWFSGIASVQQEPLREAFGSNTVKKSHSP